MLKLSLLLEVVSLKAVSNGSSFKLVSQSSADVYRSSSVLFVCSDVEIRDLQCAGWLQISPHSDWPVCGGQYSVPNLWTERREVT